MIKDLWKILVFILLLAGAFGAGYFLRPEPKPRPPAKPIEPKIIYRDSLKVVEVPIDVEIDSAAVVKAYYTKRPFYFEDTVQEVKIKFTGTLFENSLTAPRLVVQDLRPQEVAERLSWSGWVGGYVGRETAAVTLAVQYERNMFEVSYNALNSSFLIGYKRKIW